MRNAVAVIGTGPAGMAAAWAAALRGRPLVLISASKDPSEIGGAQFLHSPLPKANGQEFPDPDFHIKYLKWGRKHVYQEKVWDGTSIPFSSWDNVQDEPVPAWSLRSEYERLFEMLAGNGRSITVIQMDPWELDKLVVDTSFDLIVSTIPRPLLCKQSHAFESVGVSLGEGQYYPMEPNTVIYNGETDFSWVRASLIDGQQWTEWGDVGQKPLGLGLIHVVKPIRHRCTCWGDVEGAPGGKVLFAGRFGSWTKGKLVDSAFHETWERLA